MKKILALLVALMLIAASTAMADVTVTANPESKTGYSVSFSYENAEAKDVQLIGGFQFYKEGDLNVFSKGVALPKGEVYADQLINWYDWEPNAGLYHTGDDGATVPMTRDENGVWTASIDLPGGIYQYQFKVSADGENYEKIADPNNEPACNAYTGADQGRCQFFVPYDEKQGDPANYDWSWVFPEEDDPRGTIDYVVYEGKDGESYAQIYLPAHYDANRAEGYKTLYLSHGGGGNEADWFHQGYADELADKLMAAGACEEFVIVCMNNEVYRTHFKGTDNNELHLYSYSNIKDFLMPYVEANYNVSKEAADRAFCGLSNGAKLTNVILSFDPTNFGYYALLTGSASWSWPTLEDYSVYDNIDIYLASSWCDQLLMGASYRTAADKTMMGIKEKLEASGVTYNDGNGYVMVNGGHDWWTWPQHILDYFSNVLWK